MNKNGKGRNNTMTRNNETTRNLNVWAIVALLGIIATTALEGTGLTFQDFDNWSLVISQTLAVFGNPLKLVTITLAVVAYFLPPPVTLSHLDRSDKYREHTKGGR